MTNPTALTAVAPSQPATLSPVLTNNPPALPAQSQPLSSLPLSPSVPPSPSYDEFRLRDNSALLTPLSSSVHKGVVKALITFPFAYLIAAMSMASLPAFVSIFVVGLCEMMPPAFGVMAGAKEYEKIIREKVRQTPLLNTLGPNATVGDANRAIEKSQA
jgi:hypothetical protein